MAPSKTNWPGVAIVILAGIAVALQVGKVPVAMPEIRADMGSSLITLSWIFAIFSLMTASLGTIFGSLARPLGLFRVGIAGMLICALGNVLGAFAGGAGALLATRMLEGLGFLMVLTSFPTLVLQFSSEPDRPTAMAFWSLFIPAGSFVAMVSSGPIFEISSWRVFWLLIAGVLVISAGSVAWLSKQQGRDPDPKSQKTKPASPGALLALVRNPGRLVASLTFGLYSGQYMVVTGFIALILKERLGLTAVQVGAVVAVIVLTNAGGNASAALFFRRGWRSSSLIIGVGLVLLVAHALIFALPVPPLVQLAGMLLFGYFSGLVPASLFASLPRLAPSPEALPIVSGMIMQGSAIGQLISPPAVAAVVGIVGGWIGAAVVLVLMSLSMIACAGVLRARGV